MEQEIENVVIVSADSLREKDLKEAPNEEYPFLQKFMKRPGDYYSNASWTVPAHASIFSGKLPSEHGTSSQDMYFKEENRLTQFFSEQGFQNILLSENDLLTAGLGLSDGFDESYRLVRENGVVWNDESWRTNTEKFAERWTEFGREIIKNRDRESAKSFTGKIGEKIFDRQIGEKFNPTYTGQTIGKILEYVNQDEKTFIFTNWMITHYDYTFTEKEKQEYLPDVYPEEIENTVSDTEFHKIVEREGISEEELEIIQKAYKASIKYLDRQLEFLWEKLPKNTLLVVIGDHGEVVGEKKHKGIPIIEHHFGTYEMLLEVPYRYRSKGKEANLSFDLASHIQFRKSIVHLINDGNFEGADNIVSEYYGKGAIAEFFNQNYPEEYSELYERRSFSIFNKENKFDILEGQNKYWEKGSYEEHKVDAKKPNEEDIPAVLKLILNKNFV